MGSVYPGIYQTKKYLQLIYAFFPRRYLLKVAELFEKLRVREALEGEKRISMWMLLFPVTYQLFNLFCRR